ncbi:hypothetical protein BDW74DRAFT_151544 [Aspergillus multicolor]|uniref:uncharacterized protein n=1 Tax=Aspergillus multicolor TaxID=41759 RepID=UPI003CCD4088
MKHSLNSMPLENIIRDSREMLASVDTYHGLLLRVYHDDLDPHQTPSDLNLTRRAAAAYAAQERIAYYSMLKASSRLGNHNTFLATTEKPRLRDYVQAILAMPSPCKWLKNHAQTEDRASCLPYY